MKRGEDIFMQALQHNEDHYIKNANEQIHSLHDNTDGWITLARKKPDSEFQNYHYKLNDISNNVDQWAGIDGYVSMNTFYTPRRLITNLRELRTFYVDLDCYNVNLTPTQVVMALQSEHFNITIPTPNLINYSGRGINLIWFLDPISGLAIERWDRLQKAILKTLEPLGSDAASIDAARVFRLTGSINSKNNATVQTEMLHNHNHDFNAVVEEYFPAVKEIKKPKSKRNKQGKSKKSHIFNEFTLIKARMNDINTLVESRNKRMTGCRELALFLYRYWCIAESQSFKKALEATHELNSTLDDPLPYREVSISTKSAEMYYEHEEGFNISNEKIIEWLGITTEEQENLSTIISKNEKRKRKRLANEQMRRSKGMKPMQEYNAERKQQQQTKLDQLKQLLQDNPNATKSSMARELNVSRRTLNRHIDSLS